MKMYQFFEKLVENPDLIQIFGESGTQKSFIAFQTAKGLIEDNKKVLYIDTERNLLESTIKEIKIKGGNYHYIPEFESLMEFVDNLLESDKKYDWIILDSIGLPVLGTFALMNLKERGNILLSMQALAYKFKILSAKKQTFILVTNQPTSELGKTIKLQYQPMNWKRIYEFLDCPPFGDKMMFFFKEVLMTYNIYQNNQKTITDIIAYRSRKYAKMSTLARITRQGNEIKWEVF